MRAKRFLSITLELNGEIAEATKLRSEAAKEYEELLGSTLGIGEDTMDVYDALIPYHAE